MRRQIWLILDAARLTAAASFFLLGIVHFDDVAVNRHLSEIRTHILCSELRHLDLMIRCSFSDTQNSMRIGLVLFAIGNLSFRKDRGFGRHPNKHFEE